MRRTVLKALAIAAMALGSLHIATAQEPVAPAKRPNIILILVDDADQHHPDPGR